MAKCQSDHNVVPAVFVNLAILETHAPDDALFTAVICTLLGLINRTNIIVTMVTTSQV
jgi:hypothetical protein